MKLKTSKLTEYDSPLPQHDGGCKNMCNKHIVAEHMKTNEIGGNKEWKKERGKEKEQRERSE